MTDREETPDERDLLALYRRAGERSGSSDGGNQSTTTTSTPVETELRRIFEGDRE